MANQTTDRPPPLDACGARLPDRVARRFHRSPCSLQLGHDGPHEFHLRLKTDEEMSKDDRGGDRTKEGV